MVCTTAFMGPNHTRSVEASEVHRAPRISTASALVQLWKWTPRLWKLKTTLLVSISAGFCPSSLISQLVLDLSRQHWVTDCRWKNLVLVWYWTFLSPLSPLKAQHFRMILDIWSNLWTVLGTDISMIIRNITNRSSYALLLPNNWWLATRAICL